MQAMDWTAFFSLFLVLVSQLVLQASANTEGDALNALKNNLAVPNNVLQSWDPTLVNPCTWLNITCNRDNSVTRVDLGNANLTGELVPQLGQLVNLQYLGFTTSHSAVGEPHRKEIAKFPNCIPQWVHHIAGKLPNFPTLINTLLIEVPSRELFNNNISGPIPKELGNLTSLVSLDLFSNRLSGPIPDTLGKLQKLRFLRLYNNNLSGNIPMSLTTINSLQVLDMSNNMLTGAIPVNGSFSLFPPLSFAGNNLDYPPVSSPPTYAPSPSPSCT